MKSISCDPKNAGKFKSPRDNPVKAICFFSVLTQPKDSMRKVHTHKVEICKRSNENMRKKHVSFEIISHLYQNFLACQTKTLP